MKKKLLFALLVSALLTLLCGAALAGTPEEPCKNCADVADGWTDWEPYGNNMHRVICKHCYGWDIIMFCESETVTEAKDPTCTEDGHTKEAECGVCGRVMQELETIPALGHTPGAEATCTTAQTCSRCTYVYQTALGHNPGAEATCTTAQTCTRCTYVYQTALGHKPGAEATCTSAQTCTRCNYVYQTALGHDYKPVKKVAASCTKDGYTVYECANCKDSYRSNYTEHLMHWFDLWNANEDDTHTAKCTREGCNFVGKTECTAWEVTIGESILTICPVCGRFNTESFEAIAEASIEGSHAIDDEVIVRGMKAPFDGVLYAFTAGYEYSGRMRPFEQTSRISLPLDASEYASFKLVRVDVTPVGETTERAEVWTEIPYSFADGMLSFESECEGLFLLISAETAQA